LEAVQKAEYSVAAARFETVISVAFVIVPELVVEESILFAETAFALFLSSPRNTCVAVGLRLLLVMVPVTTTQAVSP